MRRKLVCIIILLILQITGLACSLTIDDGSPITELPTPMPSPMPTPLPPDDQGEEAMEDAATPTAPPGLSPQTLTGEGAKNDYSSAGAVCLLYQPVTLMLKGDGSAELVTTGADIIDHTNCTTGSSEETWYITGIVAADSQTVTFQTCNFGNFTADGSLSFAQGVLSGQVSCTNKDGIKFITLLIGQ